MGARELAYGKVDQAYVKALKGSTHPSQKMIDGLRGKAKELAKELDWYEAGVLGILQRANSRKGLKKASKKGDIKDAKSRHSDLLKRLKALKMTSRAAILELKQVDKKASPDTYRAIKVFGTGVDALASTGSYVAKSLQKQIETEGRSLTKEENEERTMELAMSQLKKALRKAKKNLQIIKSDPTAVTWKNACNDGMTRDLHMALTALKKAQDRGMHSDRGEAGRWKDHVQPWDTGALRHLVKKHPGEVAKRRKDFSRLCKDLAAEYHIRF